MSHPRYYTLKDFLCYRMSGRRPELAFKPGRKDDFETWRCALVERIVKCFGTMPQPVDLCPETLLVKELEGIRAEKIVFDSSEGMSVPAWLLLPEGCSADAPRPVVLLIPGHTGHTGPETEAGGRTVNRTHGKAQYVGLDPDGNPADTGVNNDVGQALARAGFVVLCPDLLAFGERASDSHWARNRWMHVCDIHADGLVWLSDSSLPAIHLFDLRRCLEYLQTRAEADLQRLGVAGHSLGGKYAMYLSILDRRIKATVASCAYPSFEAQALGPKFAICAAQVLPGEPMFADGSDLLCAIAPTPLLMLFGDQDPGMSVEQANAVGQKVCGAYQSLGLADRCKAHVFQGGHDVDTPTIVQWLEQWL